jgi:hypothetical protein
LFAGLLSNPLANIVNVENISIQAGSFKFVLSSLATNQNVADLNQSVSHSKFGNHKVK